MSDFLTDDEIDEMYEDAGIEGYAPMVAPRAPMSPAPMQAPMAAPQQIYPVYPLTGIGQAAPAAEGGLLNKQVGPLPVWGWGLIAAGVGVGGYFWWQNRSKSLSANPDGSASVAALPSGDGDGKWSPSRSRFGDQLNKYFTRKGMGDRCTVYMDADDAKKKLKHVSPLITIKIEGKYQVDKDLEKLCRREGLNPTAHEDGTIGLYPTDSKRGKEWEEYIDALRDDGQTV